MDPFAMNGRSIDTDLLILRSLFAIDASTNLPISSLYILATDGQGGLSWQDIFTNISSYSGITDAGVGYLPSTINYINDTLNTASSVNGTTFSTLSTSIGYGGVAGSITGPQLFSTTFGLEVYTSTLVLNSLTSTITGINNGSAGYAPQTISTNIGLGTYGYVSSPTLQSSIMSTMNWMTSSLRSTVVGLGTASYISSSQLQSTVNTLGLLGYLSSTQLQSTVTGLSYQVALTKTSTIDGLGTYGYVSTQTLLSSTGALIRNISVDRAGNLIVYNSRVSISSLESFAFLSSFHNSSLTYKGVNGPTMASTTNRDMYFSTANLQLASHSNFLTSNTSVTLDVYPNFLFCRLNLADSTQFYPISTMVQYGRNILLQTTNVSYMMASGLKEGQSNAFQQPFRMTLKGSDIAGKNVNDYVLVHRIENCLSSNLTGGFTNSNINVYMASTNSVYVTMTNSSN